MAKERPFLHWTHGGIIGPELIDAAREAWPGPEWPGWLTYDSPGERKRAARDGLPGPLVDLLERLQSLCPVGLVTDETLHGAGAHEIPPGGWLAVHLDCDVHPRTGYRRAANAILFLDDWRTGWGGDLCLYAADLLTCERITPRAGDVAVFECSDLSFHGVPGPAIHPEGLPRRSLAVYFWEPVDWTPRRRRAQFVAMPGEPADAARDAWRAERCK